jgi:CHAT domain-containing protein
LACCARRPQTPFLKNRGLGPTAPAGPGQSPGLVLLFTLALAGCQAPPPSAYVPSHAATKTATIPVGNNEAGEACTQDGNPGDLSAAIYCGTWQQPSARVAQASQGAGGGIAAIAAGGVWRDDLDRRLNCGSPPVSTTILGRFPAMVLSCTTREGGWAQVALVAEAGGKIWLADGVRPALPAIERSIGVLSGTVPADQAATQSVSAGLVAQRLAAQAFSSGDIDNYQILVRAANRANLAGDFASAELALRQAAALQERVQGKDSPALARTLAAEALQISNQGRSAEAGRMFEHARELAKSQDENDTLVQPLLTHYAALDLLNQGATAQALAMLREAEAEYTALLPPEALQPSAPVVANASFTAGGTRSLAATLDNQELLNDDQQGQALFGVIEVRRAQGKALRQLGRTDESAAELASASDLAEARGVSQPQVTARLYRSTAVVAEAQGHTGAALSGLSASAEAFSHALPGTRTYAETELLWAAQLARAGRKDEALAACHSAAQVLREARKGTDGGLLQPCLDLYAAQAAAAPDGGQPVLTEMFDVSQLAQGSITSRQISQASARLIENARDPKVAALIRLRDDQNARLSDLYEARDDLKSGPQTKQTADADADLAKHIAALKQEQANTEANLQAASPNYNQLVPPVVEPSDLFRVLHPGEVFVTTALSNHAGWVFLLRDGRIRVAPIGAGSAELAPLVGRVRASLDADTEPPPPFDIEASQKLYSLVLGGVQDGLKGAQALSVAPSGPLLSLPFGILLTGPAQQENLAAAPWLVREVTIEHVPTPSNFLSLRKLAGTSRATRPWFGFGDFQRVTQAQAEASFPVRACADTAQLLANLQPLPGARVELEAVRRLMGAAPSDELVGSAFTAAAIGRANLKDYRVLHFATHALLPTDLQCQNEPALIASPPLGATTADGALMKASDVARLDLDADAVILSACNTGGPAGTGSGESLSGLARSFFGAGARALLVTHWSVNDRTTAYIVALTVSGARADPSQGLAGALAVAQRRMLDDAKGDLAIQAHPFYWGALAVIGEGMGTPAQHVAGL